jgi:hypothetical protein
MPWRRFGVPIAVIVLLFVLERITKVVVDWAWFSSIGYVGVFWTAFAAKATLFVAAFAVSTLLLWANATLAHGFASRRRPLPAVFDPGVATFGAQLGAWAGSYGPQLSPLVWRLLILAVALVLGLLVAMGETGRWDLILRFIYQEPYGRIDPLFNKDIGFYLFSLPVYVALKNWLLWILLLASLMAGSIYFLHDDIRLDPPSRRFSPASIAHGSALLGLYFAIKAWSYALDRYLMLYNDNGVVVGAGYTDVHVELPVLWLLVVLAAGAAIAQLQEIRTYYRFLDVDVDRYHLCDSYQQVTLAARELDPSLLSPMPNSGSARQCEGRHLSRWRSKSPPASVWHARASRRVIRKAARPWFSSDGRRDRRRRGKIPGLLTMSFDPSRSFDDTIETWDRGFSYGKVSLSSLQRADLAYFPIDGPIWRPLGLHVVQSSDAIHRQFQLRISIRHYGPERGRASTIRRTRCLRLSRHRLLRSVQRVPLRHSGARDETLSGALRPWNHGRRLGGHQRPSGTLLRRLSVDTDGLPGNLSIKGLAERPRNT